MITRTKSKRTIYISGPMEGKPNNNFAAFEEAEEMLKGMGYEVINPAKLAVDSNFIITNTPNRQDYYRKDVRALSYCTDIFMLKDWNLSHGAKFERYVALEIGVKIHYFGEVESGVLRER